MKVFSVLILAIFLHLDAFSWGFYGHKLINYHAVFMLPPEMLVLFKPNIDFISNHSVDPDKRRYAVNEEGSRHYIDMDRYGNATVPMEWKEAVKKFSEDTLMIHGIVPWWIQVMMNRLTKAFRQKDIPMILKLSAETGHYIADAHVPLHTSSNHNGQFTNQHGIHGFWESRIPELFAQSTWDLYTGRARYIKDPLKFTWERVMESARSADTVLIFERILNDKTSPALKYSYEERNGQVIKQYSLAYSTKFDQMLGGMIERRFASSILAVGSFWYTAWVNAGQPDLKKLIKRDLSEYEKKEFDEIEQIWKLERTKERECK